MKTMTINAKKLSILLLTACASLSACSSDDDDDDTITNNDTTTETEDGSIADVTTFNFDALDVNAFTRIDRSGMPAVSTALITSNDSYNEANPVVDIRGEFVPEIIASLTFLHGALDEQLQGLGLTPCTVVGDGSGTCVEFAAPLIIPDTLKIDTANAAGFPNGRLLSDPVIDVTLAVALLELTGDNPPHGAADLVGVLNPPANDLVFQAEFPFLAAPHEQ